MTEPVLLPAPMSAAILAHAQAGAPLEACGLVGGTAPASEGGLPATWYPTRNGMASATRFEIHAEDLLATLLAMEARGEAVWAIVHSHVRSAAVPSPTDVAAAAWWPGTLHLVVTLVADRPDLRAWRIEDGIPRECAVVFGP